MPAARRSDLLARPLAALVDGALAPAVPPLARYSCHAALRLPPAADTALRALAVKTLTDDPNRTLHLEGDQAIVTSELVDAVRASLRGRHPADASDLCLVSHVVSRAAVWL